MKSLSIKKAIKLIIIMIFLNFFMLSFGYGQQNGVGVIGVVPETDLNRNVKQDVQIEANQPVYKENKYLYFFEKSLGLTEKDSSDLNTHTVYDQAASKLLLWGLLFIIAIIIWIILSMADHLIFKQQKHYKHAH